MALVLLRNFIFLATAIGMLVVEIVAGPFIFWLFDDTPYRNWLVSSLRCIYRIVRCPE